MKIVCLGGGTGLSTILRGLKKYTEPTAVVTTADSGGHSGILRDELGVLPPGDIRRCLVALSEAGEELRRLFEHRFDSGYLQGSSVGNLFLAAFEKITGFQRGIEVISEILRIRGQVLPVTLSKTQLCVVLEDGQVIKGEGKIDSPRENSDLEIKEAFLEPQVRANKRVVKALSEADLITIGPGDLWTSIVPILLIEGVSKAIQRSKAKVAYLVNLMTKHGETDGYRVSDFLRALSRYLGRVPDYLLYNTRRPPKKILESYAQEKAYPVEIDLGELEGNYLIVGANLLSTKSKLIRHHPEKTASVIMNLPQPPLL